MTTNLPFNATKVLDDGYIGLVDHMGDDSDVVNAARISYGKDSRLDLPVMQEFSYDEAQPREVMDKEYHERLVEATKQQQDKDRNLIRYLMRHRHTTPFEMVEFKFIVRAPIYVFRQWHRHRTASINEYSGRYTEMIDSCHTTDPDKWRLQSKTNKQGSSGYLEEWPIGVESLYEPKTSPGEYLSKKEKELQDLCHAVYQERLAMGVAKEQARKDLPVSNYSEMYWKCDLHNILHLLSLRRDSHAQSEIFDYADAMFNLIQPIVPVSCEAFEDYRQNAHIFSAQEMELLRRLISDHTSTYEGTGRSLSEAGQPEYLSKREWAGFKQALGV